MSIVRNANGNALFPVTDNKTYEDTSFVVGDSPRTIDILTDLGIKANSGFITVDGLGDLIVEISHSGVTYGNPITLKQYDVLDLQGSDIQLIRLTHSGTDTAYRITAN